MTSRRTWVVKKRLDSGMTFGRTKDGVGLVALWWMADRNEKKGREVKGCGVWISLVSTENRKTKERVHPWRLVRSPRGINGKIKIKMASNPDRRCYGGWGWCRIDRWWPWKVSNDGIGSGCSWWKFDPMRRTVRICLKLLTWLLFSLIFTGIVKTVPLGATQGDDSMMRKEMEKSVGFQETWWLATKYLASHATFLGLGILVSIFIL